MPLHFGTGVAAASERCNFAKDARLVTVKFKNQDPDGQHPFMDISMEPGDIANPYEALGGSKSKLESDRDFDFVLNGMLIFKGKLFLKI